VEREVFLVPLRPPGLGDRAVGEVDEGHPQGRSRRRGRQRSGSLRRGRQRARQQRFKGGKGHARAHTLEESPPAQTSTPGIGQLVTTLLVRLHGGEPMGLGGIDRPTASAATLVRFRRFWNGADSMIPIKRAENRPSSRSRRSTIWSTVCTS